MRSTNKAGAKIDVIQQFANSDSSAEVLLANINIMGTEVPLHTECCISIIATLHHNAKAMLQVHDRLYRLGQVKQARRFTLVVKDTFHNHQERAMLTKWARRLLAECKLPDY